MTIGEAHGGVSMPEEDPPAGIYVLVRAGRVIAKLVAPDGPRGYLATVLPADPEVARYLDEAAFRPGATVLSVAEALGAEILFDAGHRWDLRAG